MLLFVIGCLCVERSSFDGSKSKTILPNCVHPFPRAVDKRGFSGEELHQSGLIINMLWCLRRFKKVDTFAESVFSKIF
jgi:hypothetical protein